ncbi:MAG TPA: hypothetical protein VHO73_07805, partial [Methylomirabilota bacterium]|nr:hypothetical protein [Methylomirabilota bacterium]
RFLGELKSQLDDAVRRLKTVDRSEFERLTRDYATFYRERHARLGEHRVGQGKPWGKMAAGVILLPVIAGVMNELGKGIWKAILEALGP